MQAVPATERASAVRASDVPATARAIGRFLLHLLLILAVGVAVGAAVPYVLSR